MLSGPTEAGSGLALGLHAGADVAKGQVPLDEPYMRSYRAGGVMWVRRIRLAGCWAVALPAIRVRSAGSERTAVAADTERPFGRGSDDQTAVWVAVQNGGYSYRRCWLLVADAQETALQDRVGSGQAGGSAMLARSAMALPTVAGDWSAGRSTTIPAWLPGG